jgi:hypothetical protein
MNPDTVSQHEFRPRCAKCGGTASTIRLLNDSGEWRLLYEGSVRGNGSGDAITPEKASAIIAGFTEPYLKDRIRLADLHDDGGFCLQCHQFYCPAHWNTSTSGGGWCPQRHFKSLDPHWSPD